MVYGYTYLIYGFSLDYGVSLDHKDFSSMPYGVTYPNMVHRFTSKYRVTHSNMVHGFSLDYKEFSSILYALVYGALPRNLVRVPPLGHLMSSSIDYTSYPPARYVPYSEYIWSRCLQALKAPLVYPYSPL